MSGPGGTGGKWRPDVARLAARIAAELARGGAAHPHVGAAALAARGVAGVGIDEFAEELGVEGVELAAIEAGEVPLARLPEALVRRFRLLGLERLGEVPPPHGFVEL